LKVDESDFIGGKVRSVSDPLLR